MSLPHYSSNRRKYTDYYNRQYYNKNIFKKNTYSTADLWLIPFFEYRYLRNTFIKYESYLIYRINIVPEARNKTMGRLKGVYYVI